MDPKSSTNHLHSFVNGISPIEGHRTGYQAVLHTLLMSGIVPSTVWLIVGAIMVMGKAESGNYLAFEPWIPCCNTLGTWIVGGFCHRRMLEMFKQKKPKNKIDDPINTHSYLYQPCDIYLGLKMFSKATVTARKSDCCIGHDPGHPGTIYFYYRTEAGNGLHNKCTWIFGAFDRNCGRMDGLLKSENDSHAGDGELVQWYGWSMCPLISLSNLIIWQWSYRTSRNFIHGLSGGTCDYIGILVFDHWFDSFAGSVAWGKLAMEK